MPPASAMSRRWPTVIRRTTPGGCPFQAWSLGELIRIETMLGDEARPPGAPV